MVDFISRFLIATVLCSPILFLSARCAFFPQQAQDEHIKGYEDLYSRFPFLKWLDPFRNMRYDPSMVIWNRIGGFMGLGMGILIFTSILFGF